MRRVQTTFFCLIVFSCIVMQGKQIFAQSHNQFCQQAESTASLQRCLTKHLEDSQSRLNNIYNQLLASLAKEDREEVKALQALWLSYRDAECLWRAEQSENPALKKLNELSCMTRITEDRIDNLTIATGGDAHPDAMHDAGFFPRWMNVLASDYPDVFWDYGSRLSLDLTCDNQDEKIMTGVRTRPVKEPVESLSASVYEKDILVAFVENPHIGRPNARIFTFTAAGNAKPETIQKEPVLCIERPKILFSEAENDMKSCNRFVTIQDKACGNHHIEWTGKSFDFIKPKPPAETKPEEEIKEE